MPKTLLRNVAIASLACVVAFSACQPRQPQGAESSGLTELNNETLAEATATSEVVPTTENSTSTVVETTTSPNLQATAAEEEVGTTSSVAETSSTVASTTSAAPQTTSTTATTATTTSSPAVVVTTTSAPESTATTEQAVVAPTTSTPMSYYSIDISGFSFAPSALTVQVGDTVTWTNLDSAGHTVTFSGSPSLSSGVLQEGDTHSVTFDSVGTYTYICSPHSYMQGTITVTE